MGVHDKGQLPQQVRAAQSVLALRISEIGAQAVMDHYPPITGDDANVLNPDLVIFPKNRPIFWTIYLWHGVLTNLNHQALTHWGLRPKAG